jgi:hypothetical protein
MERYNKYARMFAWKNLLLTIAVSAFSSLVLSQNPQLQTKNANLFPTLTFAFARSGENPPFYSIAIDSTGSATYQSFPYSDEKTGVPYTVEFEATPFTRSTIFRLTKQLHFFKGHFGSANYASKNASIKTLRFREGKPDNLKTDNQITYSSSRNALIQQLTSLFERISVTLEFGRRLTYLHQQHKSGMETELQCMESIAKQGRLRELQVIAPVLSAIASDATLDKVVRQRADAILSSVLPLMLEYDCSSQSFRGAYTHTLWALALESKPMSPFHIGIPQEFGPPFLVFLACDLPGSVSPFQELQRRLHFPVGSPPHRHHEREEHDPEQYLEKPPIPMHSPKVVHS